MRFGIIGTNFVSDDFMTGAKLVDEAEIVAVCSRKRENAEKFAEKYNIPVVFDNYIEMVESGKVDAVYLATPNSTHCEMAIECLKRHMPVFCEKPMGGNFKQVKKMIDAAKEYNTYLHDGTVPMYSPNLKVVKEFLPRLGKIRRAVLMFGKYSSRYDAYLRGENPTTFRKELFNGSTMDLGVYVISDAVALFGKPMEITSSATILDTGVDCLGTMLFKYEGFDVVLMHSKVTNTDIVSEIQGEDGNIYIPSVPLLNKVYYKPRKKDVSLKYDENGMVSIGNELKFHFAYEIEDFIKNVKDGRIESQINPFQQVLDIHEVLTECRLKAGIVYDCD